MSAELFRFQDVEVTRGGYRVLQVPSLSIPAGCVTAVVGDNGAGKTTLLLAAAGLLDLARGEIFHSGKPFHRGRAPAAKRDRRRFGFVFQEPYLFRRSVRSNLAFGLKIRGVGRREREQRVEQVLEQLDIVDLAARPAKELSGGERKLVALGRTLVLRPEVLFLDEVTASLDTCAAQRVEQVLQSWVDRENTSILMATHLSGPVQRLAKFSITLRDGQLGPVAECD